MRNTREQREAERKIWRKQIKNIRGHIMEREKEKANY
jgi:hypothetical protein